MSSLNLLAFPCHPGRARADPVCSCQPNLRMPTQLVRASLGCQGQSRVLWPVQGAPEGYPRKSPTLQKPVKTNEKQCFCNFLCISLSIAFRAPKMAKLASKTPNLVPKTTNLAPKTANLAQFGCSGVSLDVLGLSLGVLGLSLGVLGLSLGVLGLSLGALKSFCRQGHAFRGLPGRFCRQGHAFRVGARL